MNSLFTSKANVLKFLESKVTKSSIEDIMFFTIEDWKNSEIDILRQIKIKFKKKIS